MWNDKKYQAALTSWVIMALDKRGIKHAPFGRLMKWDDDGRTFRLLKKGKRQWSVEDLVKLSNILQEPPSYILAKVELLYKTVLEK